MSELERITAERDALKAQNEALTEQARQLIGELAVKRGAAPAAAGGTLMLRADFERLDPKARMAFVKAGGRVTDERNGR